MSVAPRYYRHPYDKAATDRLEAIPLFEQAIRSFMRVYSERQDRAVWLANGIRLGCDQLPEIYAPLPSICTRLGIDLTELFLVESPAPWANILGDTRTLIIVTSGLVELCDEAELRAALARQVGHIACHHALYHTFISHALSAGALFLGETWVKIYQPVFWAVFFWSRQTWFSADRAAALASGGPDGVLGLIAREAAGPLALTERLDFGAFVKQAEAFDTLKESTWTELLVNLHVLNRMTPLAATRARELQRWCKSDDFKRLLERIEEHDPDTICSTCRERVRLNWKFCIHCGTPVRR